MISMLAYLSKSNGIGGKIKQSPEDFVVEEILPDGTVLEIDKEISRKDEQGQFVHFILQKRDWASAAAIKMMAQLLQTSHKRFNFAGTKDKKAITTQLMSAFNIPKEQLINMTLNGIQINGVWKANDKLRLGQLTGNRFTVRVVEIESKKPKTIVNKTFKELKGVFPNYFGGQRFGTTRKNTHRVGEMLLRGIYEDAAMLYLADYEGEENPKARAARQELAETGDFHKALKFFPRYLRMERSMLAWLANHPNDFITAFRKLPRSVLLLFIHAFQSHMFNTVLSERIKENSLKPEQGEYLCGENSFGFPDIQNKVKKGGFLCMKLLGYESELNERETELLDRLGITQEDFRVRSIPEISSRGTYRLAFAPLKDFSFEKDTFHFTLPAGSYATVALSEFLDKKG